jgi:hypothetical protein
MARLYKRTTCTSTIWNVGLKFLYTHRHHKRLLNKQYPFHYYSLFSSSNNNNINTNNIILLCCICLIIEPSYRNWHAYILLYFIDKCYEYYWLETILEYFLLCELWNEPKQKRRIYGSAQLEGYPMVHLFIYALEKSDFFTSYDTCIMLLICHYLKSIYR